MKRIRRIYLIICGALAAIGLIVLPTIGLLGQGSDAFFRTAFYLQIAAIVAVTGWYVSARRHIKKR